MTTHRPTPNHTAASRGLMGQHLGWVRRLVPRLGALLAVLLVFFVPIASVSHAQFDLVRVRGEAHLPDPPADFETVELRGVTWTYPRDVRSTVHRLQTIRDTEWTGIEADLGVDVDDAIVIRIARNPDEMRALAPEGAPPPEYATGVAYPNWGVVLVSLTAGASAHSPPGVDEIFVHELSHVALRRAVGFARMPRWFVEGVAIHHSGERSMERFRTLWMAHVQDALLPLDQVEGSFPDEQGAVSLAYAQSADLVGFLRRQTRADTRFKNLIDKLEEGETFEAAMLEAYALSSNQLEREWLADIGSRMSSVPLMLGGTTFWVIASILLVWAWRRRRKKHHSKVAEMGVEEAEHDEAMARIEALLEERLAEHGPTFVTSGDPPQGREPGIPTIEHDGHDHTLH